MLHDDLETTSNIDPRVLTVALVSSPIAAALVVLLCVLATPPDGLWFAAMAALPSACVAALVRAHPLQAAGVERGIVAAIGGAMAGTVALEGLLWLLPQLGPSLVGVALMGSFGFSLLSATIATVVAGPVSLQVWAMAPARRAWVAPAPMAEASAPLTVEAVDTAASPAV